MSAVAARVLNDVARIGASIEPDGDRLILHAGDRPIPTWSSASVPPSPNC